MAYKVHPNPQSLDSLQKIFDAVTDHLLSMDKRSIGDRGCAYRSDDGVNCCAIGHLIPNDLYNPIIEKQNAAVIFWPDEIPASPFEAHCNKISEALPFFAKNRHFMDSLQRVHDRSDHWHKSKPGFNRTGVEALFAVAAAHDLSASSQLVKKYVYEAD